MIKEEIVKIFQDKIDTMERGALCFDYGNDKDAFISAMQLLEKEPCDKCVYSTREGCQYDDITEVIPPFEDTISRQEVLDQISNWSKDEFLRVTNPLDYLNKRIEYLSSVTPKQKIGHWVYDEVCSDWLDTVYKCSCCERRVSFTRAYETEDEEDDVYRNYPYCHCGVKMVRSQEDEDNTN